jgi:acetyl esterase
MALDDATTTFLTQMAANGTVPLHEMTPEEARGLTAALRELYGPGPEVHEVDDHRVPVAGGEILVRVLTPTATSRGVLVYFHGGGWVIGTVPEFDTLGRVLAERTGMTTVLVDYRLAPEHRYPTAVEDSWTALQWVAERRELLGGSGPLVVCGDSAGGNIAAVLAQRARAAGAPEIDLQVLVYPVTDAGMDTESYADPANQLMLSRDSMAWFWDHYAPDPDSRLQPDASPLRAADLSGLPPAVVVTSEFDPLRDEGVAYADRLTESGVPTHHVSGRGHTHTSLTMVDAVISGAPVRAEFCEALRELFPSSVSALAPS